MIGHLKKHFQEALVFATASSALAIVGGNVFDFISSEFDRYSMNRVLKKIDLVVSLRMNSLIQHRLM